ncbi:hypothetical protein [Methyloceanibacter sp.]|uniref:hypothetical protein n=1 Tax=Methyloceanibacter sp. TaxID=1965321 RepID=UPI002C259327|nr:hypothetical protein [Methyloceanibacter sp.]HML91117.1 hypothetical protein [Methyloceanibacter sp.]
MNAKSLLQLVAAISLVAACGTATGPALAKKKSASNTTYAVQKQTAPKVGKDCRKGPVPPFMRNPRFMNRGFLKKKCPG